MENKCFQMLSWISLMNGCSTVNMDRDSFKENQGDFSFYMTWVLLCDPHLHIKMNASITNLKNNNNNKKKPICCSRIKLPFNLSSRKFLNHFLFVILHPDKFLIISFPIHITKDKVGVFFFFLFTYALLSL